MLLHLIKKEFLIIKKYVLLMLVISVFIPPFLLMRIPADAGTMGFILSAIYSVFILLQYVSQKETQYPKAAALLCACPYPRKLLVLSKYIFCLIIYAVCCIVFLIETLLIPGLGSFHIELVILMFFFIAIFLGVYLPVQYKLGYDRTRFFFFILVMASPFVLPVLLEIQGSSIMDFINSLSPALLYVGITFFSMIILIVSASVSVSFYRNTEL